MATAVATDPMTDTAVLGELLSRLRPGRAVLFTGADWAEYARLCRVRDERRQGVRIAYDRGRLEFMSPSFRHEKWGRRIADLVGVYAEEAGIPHVGGKGTTFRREDLDRGLEPDECFYVRNAPAVFGRAELDLTRDPPPDLAVEVDASRSSLDKLEIYRGLRVPEVWRFDGEAIEVRTLTAEGRYEARPTSLAFPDLDLARLVEVMRTHDEADDGAMRRAYRAMARNTPAPPPAGP